jgi:hypothetical protein
MKTSYQPASEYERLKEALGEYEAIFGTNTYTGDKTRDEEYKNLKKRLEYLRKKHILNSI